MLLTGYIEVIKGTGGSGFFDDLFTFVPPSLIFCCQEFDTLLDTLFYINLNITSNL